MSNNINNRVRNALDECLAGLADRPSQRNNVLARVKGDVKVKKKVSVVFVMVATLLLLTVTALAVSVLSGFRFAGQGELGSPMGCTAIGDTLYYMTGEGLCAWMPHTEEKKTLVSHEALATDGISIHALLFHNEHLMLLDQEEKKIWGYWENAFHMLLDYKGTEMDIENVRFASPVFQDGYLFMRGMENEAVDASLYQADLADGTIKKLPVSAAAELTAYRPGELLVLQRDADAREDRLIVIDTGMGDVCEPLSVMPILGIEGIAYAQQHNVVYATINGALACWDGSSWVTLQGYASHHLSYYYTILDDGYVSVSHEGVQYVPLDAQTEQVTLTIRGYRASDPVDHDYQLLHPNIAILRHQEASVSIQDIREAIQAGDATDLFHVKLDAAVLDLIADGSVAPLSSSASLTADAREMLPQIAAGVFANDTLYAVPSDLFVTVWNARKGISPPKTMKDLLHAAGSGTGDKAFVIVESYSEQPWQKSDHAKYILKTYIAEAHRAGELSGLESLKRTLELLSATQLRHAPDKAGGHVLQANASFSLQGQSSDAPQPESAYVLPPAISEGAAPTVPARLHVYLLNPNAQHKEEAIAYLEYLAAHRSAHNQALLTPHTAQPMLYEGVRSWIDGIVTEQRALDLEAGLETDEAALKARVDAILADPGSWAVTEDALAVYRDEISPCLDLMLQPEMAGTASQAHAGFDDLLQTVMEYLNGHIPLEQVVERMSEWLGDRGRI